MSDTPEGAGAEGLLGQATLQHPDLGAPVEVAHLRRDCKDSPALSPPTSLGKGQKESSLKPGRMLIKVPTPPFPSTSRPSNVR